MSEQHEHEATDNWVGGIFLALVFIALWIANRLVWHTTWVTCLSFFVLGAGVVFAYFGIKQERRVRLSKRLTKTVVE